MPADLGPSPSGPGDISGLRRSFRLARSLAFILAFTAQTVLFTEPVHWLVVAPLATLLPRRRDAIIGAWFRLNARLAFYLSSWLAGVRREVHGRLPAETSLVIMNHQSVYDILLGAMMFPGPYPRIPCRASYARGIPGVSAMIRWMRCPLLEQGERASRAELRGLLDAARATARGDTSLLVFPEGHRSRDGDLLPFMRPGLRLLLAESGPAPVYALVADGLAGLRKVEDVLVGLAGARMRVEVLGPYPRPANAAGLDALVDAIHRDMAAALARMRSRPAASPGAGVAR